MANGWLSVCLLLRPARDAMRIAQRFNAGFTPPRNTPKPRQGRKNPRLILLPSLRDSLVFRLLNPALKRWAIIECPSGTRTAGAPSRHDTTKTAQIQLRPPGTP